MLSDLCLAGNHDTGGNPMVDVSEITLDKLCLLTDRSNTLITVDAPLFGSVMIFNGRILHKGSSYVDPEKIGNSMGFPAYEHILAEASRFWIVDESGVRRLKCREEMLGLLEQVQRLSNRTTQMKSANSA
jgi:hypothetical protein